MSTSCPQKGELLFCRTWKHTVPWISVRKGLHYISLMEERFHTNNKNKRARELISDLYRRWKSVGKGNYDWFLFKNTIILSHRVSYKNSQSQMDAFYPNSLCFKDFSKPSTKIDLHHNLYGYTCRWKWMKSSLTHEDCQLSARTENMSPESVIPTKHGRD